MYYLCKIQGKKLLPLLGSFRGPWDVAKVIAKLGPVEKQYGYCNVSRYEFAKMRLYPRNKMGDSDLLADMASNANLLEEFNDKLIQPTPPL